MESIKEKLICRLAEIPSKSLLPLISKITIVGAGQVGMACAICILAKSISSEICIIDQNEKKVKGEIHDLQHGSVFLRNAKITGGSDFAKSVGSKIYIVTAGVASVKSETRLQLLGRNVEIMKKIIPQVVTFSPKSIILMVTNPVDVLTYLAWKVSGFPKERVIGSGTNLDSARFRLMISKRLNIAPSSCKAYVIGEHGDSCVLVWSGASVSGVRLRDLDECIGLENGSTDNCEHWGKVQDEVAQAGGKLITEKGYTNWAIALSVVSIVEAILNDSGAVLPVSTAIKGIYNIEDEVFLSMPCVLHASGITSMVKLKLTPYEIAKLQYSANVLAKAQSSVKI